VDVILISVALASVNHRVSIHYGERHARLSRDQAILIDTAQESQRLAVLTSWLSLYASNGYNSRLNDIFTDHLVYAHQWQPFMTACLQDWRATLNLVSNLVHQKISWTDGVIQVTSTLMYVTVAIILTLNKLCIFRLHILLFFVQSSPVLALVSGSCLGASMIFSTLLVYRHEPLEDATATRAVSELPLSVHMLFTCI
jgi:hypothetical protein